MPNGILRNLYLPYGVLKVQYFELSSSSLICQNPCAASSFEKYLALAISLVISSRFGSAHVLCFCLNPQDPCIVVVHYFVLFIHAHH